MMLLIKSARKPPQPGLHRRFDLGSILLLMPFVVIWVFVRRTFVDFLGLVLLVIVAIYLKRSVGKEYTQEEIVRYVRAHLSQILLFGGLLIGAVALWIRWTFRFIRWLMGTSREKRPLKRRTPDDVRRL